MEVKRGIPVSPGIAIGEVFLLEAEGVRIPEHFISGDQTAGEVQRLQTAMDQALHELQELTSHVTGAAGPSIAEIFSAHAGMLKDPYFRDEFFHRIEEKKYTAEFSVSRTMRQWRKTFQEDAFLASRIPDLDDLERRLLRLLLGSRREDLATLTEEVILVAHDLSPSETATVDTTKVKGIAIDAGGPTGHTAIIARAMGIPAVVGLSSVTGELSGGDTIVLDGTHGIVIVNPDKETLESYRRRRTEARRTEELLVAELRELPAETPDGHRVHLMANIESPREVARAIEHGAEGIGLYRTEFLYLTSQTVPSEEDHYRAYMDALGQLDGRPMTIRTVDLGADKFANIHDVLPEKNPFMGRRSIRYCMDHPEILNDQLRAILRASTQGDVRVMFPLITCLEELQYLKKMLEQLYEDFEDEGLEYDRDMEVGIMIEVPSAALCADILAQHCDFFSIGTNDLIQYTLAIDRANEHVAHMYRPINAAVLRLIRMSAQAARENGISAGLCGEMGSEILYAVLLLGLGIDHFSVAPPVILPELKKIVRSVEYQKAVELAETVLSHPDMDEAMELVMALNRERMPELFP